MGRRQAYRARTAFYLTGGAIFLVVAVLAVLFALGYRIDTAERTLYKTGLVVLKSQPAGAFVTINDELRSERTSARLALAPGSYSIKIDRPGTLPWQKRVTLKSGDAILEEDILLFLQQPKEQTISPAPGSAVALTSDAKQVQYVRAEAAASEVHSYDLTTQHDRTVGPLPAGVVVTGLVASDDDSRTIALGNGVATVTGSSLPTPVSLPGITAARFAPNNRDQVITQTGGSLIRTTLADASRTTVQEGVTTWTTTRSATYAATAGRSVVRIDQGTPRPLLDGQIVTELTPLATTDAVFARTADRTLYLLTPDGTRQIAEDIDRFAATGDGSVVALVSRGELTVWRQTDGNRRLVTRSATPFDDLAIVTDGHYLLYIQAGQIHVIAVDGSNDQVLLPAGGPLRIGSDTTIVRQLPGGIVADRILAE